MLIKTRRTSLLRAMLLSVGAALLVIQVPTVVYDIIQAREDIKATASQRADAALDMLEAVHIQAMLNRGRVEDGDPAVATLNGSMAQFSAVSRGVALWVFMGPKVLDFQKRAGETEVEPPRDALDEEVVVAREDRRALFSETLRVSRPVVLGYGHAAAARCVECHTGLMGIAAGEVIGGYGAAVDLAAEFASWRADAARHVGIAIILLLVTLALIVALLRSSALRPLRLLAAATQRLAQGDVDVALNLDERHDELGDMARSLDVFRTSLIMRERLERENAAAQQEVRYLASHDPLTGLPNRTLFAERVEAAIATMRRSPGLAAVLCLDLDHFKDVNDTFGHAAGDQLLRIVANRLCEAIRDTDTAARIGGDEFAIIQVGVEHIAQIESLCQRLIAAFAEPVCVAGQELIVSPSIGVAVLVKDGSTMADLLQHADVALYRAKAEGRNTFRFFAPEMDHELQERRGLEQDLRQALLRQELELHYQPMVDVATRQIVGVEALMRWHHPVRGSVSPAVFIPVAERTGLILPMGEWLLRTACQQAAAWPGTIMSINLSPIQFRHPDIVELVRQVLEETGLPAERLELEITEGVLLEETELAVTTLRALQALGVKIAMDDFGTGYSSLSYLRSFPFDKLKIDQSFVRLVEEDTNARAIVRSVVALGRSLGMVTTAEGVETSAQLAFLRREGCDQVQGFYLARPQSAAIVSGLLADEAAMAARPAREMREMRDGITASHPDRAA